MRSIAAPVFAYGGDVVASICVRHYIPFPDPPEPLKAEIRAIAEELDAFRKQRQAAHPKLTLTQMYNVLEKLKAQEREIRELRQANEILRKASAYFAMAELDRRPK